MMNIPIIDSPALTKGLPSTPWNTMNMAGREPITKQRVNAGFHWLEDLAMQSQFRMLEGLYGGVYNSGFKYIKESKSQKP